MRLAKKRTERNDQIRNMAAIKDKETGEARLLTKDEKERIMANRDDARERRFRKLTISENKAKAEEIREYRKEEAKEKEVDDALAELFDRWHVEARRDDETIEEMEESEEESRDTKRAKTGGGSSEGKREWNKEEATRKTHPQKRQAEENEGVIKENERVTSTLDDKEGQDGYEWNI